MGYLKTSETILDSNLTFFSERIPGTVAIQVVKEPGALFKRGKDIWVVSADRFFGMLWGA